MCSKQAGIMAGLSAIVAGAVAENGDVLPPTHIFIYNERHGQAEK
jgi:hypothetical protein